VTNPQDPQRIGGVITLGGSLPGQNVQTEVCRECKCPVVYECFEDIPPRDYTEPEPYTYDENSRLRYYFELNTNQDTRDPVLRSVSAQMVEAVARRLSAGARVSAIIGYASPEDNRERPVPNQQLSLTRAQRLRERIAARLGPGAQLPEPQAGGELLGRVATIEPGSRLADAIRTVGFDGPEEVNSFLFGNDIPNPQLADQFLTLLSNHVTERADRLRLFGVEDNTPAASRLLAAINQFIARRGRGGRPWEGIFSYLRFATVELTETLQGTRTVEKRTSGSLRPIGERACRPYARQAEDENRFGPAEPEPQDSASCPSGQNNLPEYASKCDYT